MNGMTGHGTVLIGYVTQLVFLSLKRRQLIAPPMFGVCGGLCVGYSGANRVLEGVGQIADGGLEGRARAKQDWIWEV